MGVYYKILFALRFHIGRSNFMQFLKYFAELPYI